MKALIQFRRLIALTLIGFSLACLAQTARSNEAIDGVSPELPNVAQRYDFNRDGHPDLVLTTTGGGQTGIWFLDSPDGNIFLGGIGAPTVPFGWDLIDAADFDGNGYSDCALFNSSTGKTAIWYFNGNGFRSGAYGPRVTAGWALVAVGDFNGDAKPDYILYNSRTRQTAIWYLNNNVYITGGLLDRTIPPDWHLVGVADFNADGQTDYLLSTNTNETAIWYLSGRSFVRGVYGPDTEYGFQLIGAADFDRDTHPDYVLFNRQTHLTEIWYLINNQVRDSAAVEPNIPLGWSLALP